MWTRGGKRQKGHIATQSFKFATTFSASAQMLAKLSQLAIVIERVHHVERKGISVLCVVLHENAFLSASSPERIRVFTVPSGSPVLLAISVCVKPSKNAIS